MTQYALVDSNRNVTNIIEWNGTSPYSAPAGFIMVLAASGCAIGGTYANSVFTAPVTSQPTLTTPQKIAQLEALQTVRMVREALANSANVFPANHPNFPGMTSAQALAQIEASIAALRGS